MREPSHIRVVSLALALSVVIGGWALFEYGNRPSPPITTTHERSELPATPIAPTTPNHGSVGPNQQPSNLNIIYKCEKAGRISFGDKPCAANERTLAITATEKAPTTRNNLEELCDRAAVWEASKSDRATEAKSANAVIVQSNEIRCQQIDRAIATKDSELRQPHSAQMGDYLAGERKKLYDERFSLGC